MSTTSTVEKCTEVTLLGPEGGPQTFTLPEGATLADLLRRSRTPVRSPSILIDARPIEEVLVLKSGMTVTIMPEPPQTPAKKDWRKTVGMFADDPTFDRRSSQKCQAIREADSRCRGPQSISADRWSSNRGSREPEVRHDDHDRP